MTKLEVVSELNSVVKILRQHTAAVPGPSLVFVLRAVQVGLEELCEELQSEVQIENSSQEQQ